MPKLSEYVNKARPRKLAVCTRSTRLFQHASPVIEVWFEDRTGDHAGLLPCDFGLPGVVSKFNREENHEAGYTTIDLILTLVLFAALLFDGLFVFKIADTIKLLPSIDLASVIAAAVGF